MSIKLDHDHAKQVLFEEFERSENLDDELTQEWVGRVDELSRLCPYRKSSSFLAALGTAMLAKSVDQRVDVYSLLDRDEGENSYSARSLADNVWAKNRAILGIDLGANGANPLNNTPIIGKSHISEIKNVRNKEGFAYFCDCLDLLQTYREVEAAKKALRAFISVRRTNFDVKFQVGETAGDHFVLPSLVQAIVELLSLGSEDGRIAQAVAAGSLAIAFGDDCIEVGHINDPDRNFPLDVVVSKSADAESIRFAVEVKDKSVGTSEVLSSVEKASKFNVKNVVFLAVAGLRLEDPIATYERARDYGCKLIVFSDWESFLQACLTASDIDGPKDVGTVYQRIGAYLVELGASETAVKHWEIQASR